MNRLFKHILLLSMVLALVLSACTPATQTAAPVVEEAATDVPVAETAATDMPVAATGSTLVVTGLVDQELSLNSADLGDLEVVTVTAEHPKKGPGEYTGVRLSAVLEKAGVKSEASALLATASDDFTAEIPLTDLQACADCLLGVEEGMFNLVMPGMSSKAWVKDVVKLELIVAAAAEAPAEPVIKDLILATTTSTQDSGLLDVLVPLFEEQTGYVVKTIAVGTGEALKMGEEGNADVLLVHAPASEVAFMENGFGSDRKLVMHNDFVIVGPAADPAGIKGVATAVEAFQKIAASGAIFVSRGDDSGTHKMELKLWDQAAAKPAGDAYQESGQGMGATLTIASEKAAYTLTDRATYLANMANFELAILVEGDNALLNVYHVIVVNPEKWPKVNNPGAIAFADFMVAKDTQAVIGEFGKEEFGQALFVPDADKTDADLGLK